jgi:transposase
MKILCNEKAQGKPPKPEIKALKEQLKTFYTEHYLPTTQHDPLDYTHINTVLDYLTEDILTMYENNIELHYVEYVERYVNVVWKKKFLTEKIRKLGKTKAEREARIRNLCNELRKIKNDLLNVENNEYKSKPYYHAWIQEQKKHILPTKSKFNQNSIYYDLKCTPFQYFPCMISMMKQVEKDGYKVCNVFPMRSGITPNYIRLDTTTLVHLLMRKEHGTKNEYLTEGNLKRNEDKIWNFFFRTELKCFKKTEYSFHNMLSTDGVSVSILLLRNDLVGKKLPMMKKKGNREMYIDEVTYTTHLQTKKMVGIDAGKCDLIYCVDDASKEANVFRYSQDQRRKETKLKKYANIRLGLKHKVLEGKNIIEYETELSNYNRKTLQIDKFKEYLQAKNKLNHVLFDFYRKNIFRKLKMNAYINTKRTEQKMIQQFQDKFGKPDETIICIGDWEQRKQMKFKEPTIGIGMRTLFRKRGYQVYLVDEFRTSCRCSNCNGGICEKFKVGNHPNPKKEEMRLIHGLLRCKNGCGLWNRDRNGASNIFKIAYQAIHKLARPTYLCR